MTFAMLKIASQTGTEQMVVTPHIISEKGRLLWTDIVAGCRKVQNTAQRANMKLAILPGAEVTIHPDVLDLLPGPGPYCVNSGRYMLVELPWSVIPLYIDKFFFTLQIRGITPILAHPERYPEIRANYSILRKWLERGILVQINGSSLTGQMGENVKIAAQNLLKWDMVHCIGSDAHNNLSRSPDLTMVRKKIKEFVGVQRAERILLENPNCIINSREIRNITDGLAERPKKKSMFNW